MSAANLAALARGASDRFGAEAPEFLRLCGAGDADSAALAAHELSGDGFIAPSSRRWMEAHLRNGRAPVFRQRFDQPLPLKLDRAPGRYYDISGKGLACGGGRPI